MLIAILAQVDRARGEDEEVSPKRDVAELTDDETSGEPWLWTWTSPLHIDHARRLAAAQNAATERAILEHAESMRFVDEEAEEILQAHRVSLSTRLLFALRADALDLDDQIGAAVMFVRLGAFFMS